jgi:nickel-dependent lactate racemase
LVQPSFLVNTVVDERGLAQQVYAGDWRLAHKQACEDYHRQHACRIDERREVVIASCGGSPWDINLIQAHKALDMAAQGCVEGGSIILLAECADGLGRSDFLKWFEEGGDSRALEERLRAAYEVNGQTAWALLTKAEKFQVQLISELPAEAVRRMGLRPAGNIEEALAQVNGGARGYILPRGARVLPFVG